MRGPSHSSSAHVGGGVLGLGMAETALRPDDHEQRPGRRQVSPPNAASAALGRPAPTRTTPRRSRKTVQQLAQTLSALRRPERRSVHIAARRFSPGVANANALRRRRCVRRCARKRTAEMPRRRVPSLSRSQNPCDCLWAPLAPGRCALRSCLRVARSRLDLRTHDAAGFEQRRRIRAAGRIDHRDVIALAQAQHACDLVRVAADDLYSSRPAQPRLQRRSAAPPSARSPPTPDETHLSPVRGTCDRRSYRRRLPSTLRAIPSAAC